MVEAKSEVNAIPSGFYSAEVQQQITQHVEEVKQRTSSESNLKPLFVWIIMIIIIIFAYILWRNLSETEQKFKI